MRKQASAQNVADRFLGFTKEGGDTFASFLDDLSNFAEDRNCRGISSLFSVWRTKAPKWGFDRATIVAMESVLYEIRGACRR